ncbi:hypothetical protein [Natronobacterium texcoconense]|uniref:Uncharacterized protein n=1 Tax=Natronobacterium texcoconense TaxID=1095778 RepID=A0A1H1IQJ6_NATTX|nr:hypothetical protein [Natronobacterium texcoconense]SDR39952.1 hypothetical protein SAMN04489842_3725 [Natronobacterium texcoconense]
MRSKAFTLAVVALALVGFAASGAIAAADAGSDRSDVSPDEDDALEIVTYDVELVPLDSNESDLEAVELSNESAESYGASITETDGSNDIAFEVEMNESEEETE